MIERSIGDGGHHGHYKARQTDAQDFAGDVLLGRERFRVRCNDRILADVIKKTEEIPHRNEIRKHGRDGCALDVQPEYKNEDWVENDVQDTAERHTESYRFGIALSANQVRQLRIHHSRHSADADRPEGILTAIHPSVRTGTQNRKQHRLEQDNGNSVEQRDRRARPDAERRAMPRFLLIARAEAAGNETGAAQAKEVGEAGQQHKARHGNRRRRHLQRVVELSDEERVRHVVDHSDELADDCGDRQRQHSFLHRRVGE